MHSSECCHYGFFYQSENQDVSRSLWLAETFSTSLKPLNIIRKNLTGSQISTSSELSSFLYFRPIRKIRWPSQCLFLLSYFWLLLWNRLNGIWWNLIGSKNWMSSTKLMLFRPMRKPSWPLWPLIGWDIFNFFSENHLKQYLVKVDRKQELNVLYQVCVFCADLKTRWQPLCLIARDIFDFFSETAEQN